MKQLPCQLAKHAAARALRVVRGHTIDPAPYRCEGNVSRQPRRVRREGRGEEGVQDDFFASLTASRWSGFLQDIDKLL